MKSLKSLIPKPFKIILRLLRGKLRKRPADNILGYKEFCTVQPSRKALISYLVSPLLPVPSKRGQIIFSSLGIAQIIPRVLNELGYEVDIVSWDNTEWLPKRYYDLYIGHGGINFEHISRALSKETTQIYFSTGIYWQEFNIREAKRIYELTLRKGYLLHPDRPINSSEEYANKTADGIICLGNKNAVETFRKFPLVIGINNAAYPLEWKGLALKNFQHGRKHFLFFSSEGNIHKGLDLLLEAFIGTDLHLHICQPIDSMFAQVYQAELTRQSNIHLYGHIRLRSEEFEQLALLCNWVISTTACEGQSGLTLECMAYGIIPILTAGANIDLENFGIFLPENSITDIRKVIFDSAKIDVDECEQRAILTLAAIREKYSPDKFNINFKNAIQQIVSKKLCRLIN